MIATQPPAPTSPEPVRCVFCGRRAVAALERIADGHQTPVCRAHQRIAAAGSGSPGYEFVSLEPAK